jgi:hypothetical protein
MPRHSAFCGGPNTKTTTSMTPTIALTRVSTSALTIIRPVRLARAAPTLT